MIRSRLRSPSRARIATLAVAAAVLCSVAVSAAEPRSDDDGWLLAGWRPLASLGLGEEAASPPVQTGVRKLNSFLSSARSVIWGFTPHGRARALLEDVMERLEDLDLEEAWQILPDRSTSTPWRGAAFEGLVEGPRYNVRLVPGAGADANGWSPLPAGDDLLDASLRLALRPVDPRGRDEFEDNFQAVGESVVCLDDLHWPQLLAAGSQWLRLLEPPTEAPDQFDALLRSRVARKHPALGAEDRAVLARVARAWPATYERIDHFVVMEDVVTSVVLVGNTPATRVQVRSRMRADLLEREQPAVAEYLAALESLLDLEVRVLDGRGQRLLSLRSRSEDLSLTMDLVIRNGRILPCVDLPGGRILDTRGYALDEVQRLPFTTLVSLTTDISGVVGKIRDLTLTGLYAHKGDLATVSTRVSRAPTVSFSGRFWGIIPTWFVDIFIPSDIETLTTDFFRVLRVGDGGKGARSEASIQRTASDQTVLKIRGDSEVLNNAMVTLAVKIGKRRLLPGEEARDEFLGWLRQVVSAIEQDSARVNSEAARAQARQARQAPASSESGR